ncbi:hypothetical protein E4T56_gene14945 [Termitomyces sp. T112]|nr:hypothetical protein E4T56_gene14945 [Termitomyces sp. T112]
MYDRDWRIWTDQVVAAPAKFVHDEEGRRGHAIRSLISQDCIVSGATAYRSLLFTGVKMGSWSQVNEGVILPYCNIGRHAKLSRVIIDSGVRIPEGLVVGEDPELDAKRFRRTENGVIDDIARPQPRLRRRAFHQDRRAGRCGGRLARRRGASWRGDDDHAAGLSGGAGTFGDAISRAQIEACQRGGAKGSPYMGGDFWPSRAAAGRNAGWQRRWPAPAGARLPQPV